MPTGPTVFLIQGGIIANPSILPLAPGQGARVTGFGSIVLDGIGSNRRWPSTSPARAPRTSIAVPSCISTTR
jgi:hypothetical protein